MRAKVEPTERVIARIADRQHGVVTRSELLRAAVTRAEIQARLASGVLLPEYRGVYRVGHRAPSVEARYMAAVKAGGDGALLAGRAAAHLLGILKGPPPVPTVITPKPRRVRGLRTRTSRGLGQRDGTVVRGIPVTTVPSTLVDCASLLSLPDLARACHEAGVKYGTTPRQVEAVLKRRPNAPGATNLRKVLSGEQRVTLSALERAFLKLLEEANLPLPQTNKPAGTAPATPGSRTGGATARPMPGATRCGATPTTTSSTSPTGCSLSCATCWSGLRASAEGGSAGSGRGPAAAPST